MPISESLASGFAHRFLSEYKTDLVKAFDTKSIAKLGVLNRLNFESKISHLMRPTEKLLIGSKFIGGSRARLYVAETYSNIYTHHRKERIEKSLHSLHLIHGFEKSSSTTKFGHYALGEHAIKRVYQRILKTDESATFSIDLILSQARDLSAWSSFWFFVLADNLKFLKENNLSIAMPSSDGMFFGEISENEVRFDVRTFVSIQSLAHNQRKVREFGYHMMDKLSGREISFTPVIFHMRAYQVILQVGIMSSLLVHSDILQELVGLMVRNVEPKKTLMVKNLIIDSLKEKSGKLEKQESLRLLNLSESEADQYIKENTGLFRM